MAEEFKCPVCGKAGINDYHNEDVICPCCGSDLSVFRVIDNIPESISNKKGVFWKCIAGAACVVAIVFGFSANSYHASEELAKAETAQYIDSISSLSAQIAKLKKQSVDKPVHPTYHKHIVLPGDNLWKISRRYYNTGTRYAEIAEWNNIDVHARITAGDTLIIK